jgi:uncharacterized protein Yka (UPF0111/DUF47 family)
MGNIAYFLPPKAKTGCARAPVKAHHDQAIAVLSDQLQRAVSKTLASGNSILPVVEDLMASLENIDQVIDCLDDTKIQGSLRVQAERNRKSLLEAVQCLSLEMKKLPALHPVCSTSS